MAEYDCDYERTPETNDNKVEKDRKDTDCVPESDRHFWHGAPGDEGYGSSDNGDFE